jgi:hypothetical protein
LILVFDVLFKNFYGDKILMITCANLEFKHFVMTV